MAEEHKGYIFSSREERGLPPLTQEEIDEAQAAFAEFDAARAAVPADQRHEIADRFGGWDGWDDEKQAPNDHEGGAQEKGGANE